MATRTDLAELRGEFTSGISDLRASLFHALWLQGGAYAALIIELAGVVVPALGGQRPIGIAHIEPLAPKLRATDNPGRRGKPRGS